MKTFYFRKTAAVITVTIFITGYQSIQAGTRSANAQLQQSVTLARQEALYCRRELKALKNRNRLLQNDYSTLAERFTAFEQQLKNLKSSNMELSRQVAALKLLLAEETKNRDGAIRDMAKNIVKQTSSAINSASKRQTNTARFSGGPVGKGDFYEYTVQRGATLSAIAKAYKVKVSDIRRANRLKNDNIKAGQTLYIPKKR